MPFIDTHSLNVIERLPAASTQRRYFYIAQNLCHYIGGTISLSEVTAMDIGDYLTHNLPPNCSDT